MVAVHGMMVGFRGESNLHLQYGGLLVYTNDMSVTFGGSVFHWSNGSQHGRLVTILGITAELSFAPIYLGGGFGSRPLRQEV